MQTMAVIESADISNVLNITFADSLNNSNKKIIVIPNYEYIITFYDSNSSTMRTLQVLVENVYQDQIKVKYVSTVENKTIEETFENCSCCNKADCVYNKNNNSKIINTPPIPTCGCIFNPTDTSKYDGPEIIYIPIQNITNIEYVITEKEEDDTTINIEGGTYVMILGISTSLVKAVIVQMNFFDDMNEEAFKYIELQAGNIYDIVYEGEDRTIYETRARVIKIEEETSNCITPKDSFVREYVDGNNTVYTNSCCDHTTSKEDFINGLPVRKVRIIIDTSLDFNGRYECITLDKIRDVNLVSDFVEEDEDNCCNSGMPYPPYHPNEKPDCKPPFKMSNNKERNCGCKRVYKFGNYEVINDGNIATIKNGDKVDKIPVDEIFKFYLGIE